MSAVHLAGNARPDEVSAALDENGYVILDDLVSPALIETVRAEMQPYVDATPFGGDEAFGRHTKRTGRLVERSPAGRELIMTPNLLAAIRNFLGRGSSNIQLSTTQMISVSPGNKPQPLHRDEGAWDFFPWPQDYHVQVNVLWAMTEFTEHTGATVLVPGSHIGPQHDPDKSKLISAEMSPGSAILLTGKIYHGTGANRSNQVRQALDVNYAVGWVRQGENQYLSTPLEVARTLPADLLRLMGYEICGLGTGYVGDYEDPMSVIDRAKAMNQFDIQQTKTAANARRSDSIDARLMIEQAE